MKRNLQNLIQMFQEIILELELNLMDIITI